MRDAGAFAALFPGRAGADVFGGRQRGEAVDFRRGGRQRAPAALPQRPRSAAGVRALLRRGQAAAVRGGGPRVPRLQHGAGPAEPRAEPAQRGAPCQEAARGGGGAEAAGGDVRGGVPAARARLVQRRHRARRLAVRLHLAPAGWRAGGARADAAARRRRRRHRRRRVRLRPLRAARHRLGRPGPLQPAVRPAPRRLRAPPGRGRRGGQRRRTRGVGAGQARQAAAAVADGGPEARDGRRRRGARRVRDGGRGRRVPRARRLRGPGRRAAAVGLQNAAPGGLGAGGRRRGARGAAPRRRAARAGVRRPRRARV